MRRRSWENPGSKQELIDLAYVAHDLLLSYDTMVARGEPLPEWPDSGNVYWLRTHPVIEGLLHESGNPAAIGPRRNYDPKETQK